MIFMDDKACYDRIVHNIATICMMRTGIEYNYIKGMFLTLSQMNQKIQAVKVDYFYFMTLKVFIGP